MHPRARDRRRPDRFGPVSGSGGYILIWGGALSLGTSQVSAIGGSWTQSTTTVHSGDGYIVLKGAGTTSPAATQL